MLLEACAKVTRAANVAFSGVAEALQQVDAVQCPPFFAEASKGILLRDLRGGNPAKLEERSRMAETEGFEPSVGSYPYGGLANRWFQPLTHVSGKAFRPRRI